MKRSLLFVLLLASSFVFARQSTYQAPSQPVLSVAAKAYILTDFQSGQTLVGQSVHERVEPASLTKMMTAHVTFSALKQKRITLTQTVPVSENAWHAHGSRMFIEPSKPVTVSELVRGLIVQSGNDASIALAEAIAGSEENFTQMMNKEAENLGMKNTHFANSTGLPHAEHYSTAHDLALLAADMIRNFPEYYPLYSLREYTYNKISQTNRNRLLWMDPNVDGLKTGYTQAAGYCLVTSARRSERRLISIILGATSDNARTMESQRLLNYGFQFYDTVRLYRKKQEVTTIQLWKGERDILKTGFNHDLYFSLPKGQSDKLKASMEYKQPLIAPISTGQKVGVVKFTLDGEPIAEHPLVALETVDPSNFFSRTWDSLRLLFN